MSTRFFSHIALASIFCAALVGGSLTAVPAQAQKPTTVYGFPGQPGPSQPNIEAIAQGRDGNLYLTAAGGDGKAINCTVTYCGEAFYMTTSGAVHDIYDFSNNDCPTDLCGINSYGGLTLGSDGNFYGAFYNGVNGNNGAIFKLTPAGVLTSLHDFAGSSDGSHPYGAPILAGNGVFYGTTTSDTVADSTAYSVTSAGKFTTLHTFTGADGQNIYAPLVEGSDGNFYGDTAAGGKTANGVIFKMTPTGTVTVLHNFSGTDGSNGSFPLIQASDGNFYGSTYSGGSAGAGVIFRITPSGTYTVLHNINGTTDGDGPWGALVQATNGTMYGVTANNNNAGVYLNGTIFSMTTSGTFKVLYTFTGGKDGGIPLSPMRQHTNGLLYGATEVGGDTNCYSAVGFNGQEVIVAGCGELYTLNVGAKPFINLGTYAGSVGSTVGIFGQDFDSASVVKFDGVAATKIVLSGTTYITATVPTGATDGRVTVTTGTTTLTSTKNYIVHNSWSKGKAMPTGVWGPAGVGVLSGQIYVVGGLNTSNPNTSIADTQIYNPATNTWSAGVSLPTPTSSGAGAVVENVLYVIGGNLDSGAPTNAVWAYNPETKSWSAKAAMLTAREDAEAVVENNIIYVVGGYYNGPLTTVESYDPATDTWKEEAPLLAAKWSLAIGLLGSTIVAADGYNGSVDTGDNEGYDAKTNSWASLKSDSSPRNAVCYGSSGGLLYVAGGADGGTGLTVAESFNLSKNAWTKLASMPQGTILPGSAVNNGLLYCIGGTSTFEGTVLKNVQIYQP